MQQSLIRYTQDPYPPDETDSSLDPSLSYSPPKTTIKSREGLLMFRRYSQLLTTVARVAWSALETLIETLNVCIYLIHDLLSLYAVRLGK